jgi:ribosome-binding protein aMBF1 (putative translation factor)
MIERCKPNKQYGKLGITVCERWLKFENFLADMGERPDGCEIDRCESTGNYEPSNCEWTLERINRQYRRTTKLFPEIREQAIQMRQSGLSYRDIAIKLNVSKSCITDFFTGEAWK